MSIFSNVRGLSGSIFLPLVCGAALLWAAAAAEATTYVTQNCVDASVDSRSPNENSHPDNFLKVGYIDWRGYSSTFIKFDLTDMPVQDVVSAKLRLYGLWGGVNVGTEVSAEFVIANWSDMGVTYSNRPHSYLYQDISVSAWVDGTQQWYEWDVTNYYDLWKHLGHSNYGISLEARGLALYGGTMPDNYRTFADSTCGVYAPTLVVTTAPVPEPITLAAVGMGIAGLGGYIRRRRAAAK